MPQTTFVNGVNPFQSPGYLAYLAAGHKSSRPGASNAYKSVVRQDVKNAIARHGALTMRQMANLLQADSILLTQLLIRMQDDGEVNRTRIAEGNRFAWQYNVPITKLSSWRDRALAFLKQYPLRNADQIGTSMDETNARPRLSQLESSGVISSILKVPAGAKRPIKHYFIPTIQ